VEEMNMDEEFDIETEASDEEVLVYEWRVEQLARLGISTLIATAVATFIDWHDVARLVQRGCSPELALEIVR
jgi:D-mannonate dehydratase